jgi:CheY-like chemotaxis protein
MAEFAAEIKELGDKLAALTLKQAVEVADYLKETYKIEPAAGGNPLRILAAEDNAANRMVLETLLGQAGVTPTVVEDGAKAVATWAAADWDVILMDVHMPVMDGIAAVREIRAQERESGRRRTPVIALTANAMLHQIAELQAAGMDHHVAKPIEVSRLFAAIETALAEAEAAPDISADGSSPKAEQACNAH